MAIEQLQGQLGIHEAFTPPYKKWLLRVYNIFLKRNIWDSDFKSQFNFCCFLEELLMPTLNVHLLNLMHVKHSTLFQDMRRRSGRHSIKSGSDMFFLLLCCRGNLQRIDFTIACHGQATFFLLASAPALIRHGSSNTFW